MSHCNIHFYKFLNVNLIPNIFNFACISTSPPIDSSQENPAVQTRDQDHSHIIYCCTFLLSTSLLVSLPWQQGQSSSPLRSSGTGRSLLSIDSNTSNTTEPPCLLYYKDTGNCVFYVSIILRYYYHMLYSN